MSETKVQIYNAFVSKTRLTDAHRAELKTKRGFNDTTIDGLKFRSGGAYVRKVIEELQKEFDETDLLDAGLLVRAKNGVILPQLQVIENRVLIPYLDENGDCYHLRPHKLGFKGLGIRAYARLMLAERPREIVLTEGEFKAAALMQWGFPAIAIPGISSFAGKHFKPRGDADSGPRLETLTDLLTEFGVEKVIVIFDNEVKDDPAHSSYKERPEDRWDTPFWAYIMADSLRKERVPALIGQLPDEWREQGKIDFDGALAQGRTRQDVQRVITSAVPPREFIHTLPPEAQRIVQRKVAIHTSPSPIRRDNNKYVIRKGSGEEAKYTTISNFVINVKSTFFTPDGCVRYVEFVNEFGETSETFILEPGDMVGSDGFRRFCFSKGSYIWQGNTADLQEVWKYELMRDMGDVVRIPEQIGEIKPGFWLFGNLAIYKGEIVKPDSDGVVWIEGTGYKPQSLAVNARGESMEDAIPALYEGDIDIKEIAHHFRGAMGGGYEACIGIGWVIATLFSRPIFQKYKAFPFPFPHGKREAGKSTIMRWMMAFFGSEVDGVSLAETSQNYIMRALSYYSSLGVWFDEYRNERNITNKDGYLRSAYNRQLSGKGIKESFGARGYTVRGTIAISGEELPRDNGLFTRIVPIRVTAGNRDREHFAWMQDNMSKFSGFVLQVLKRYDELEPQIMDTIARLKSSFVRTGISDRAAENWAILAGAYFVVVDQDGEFIRWAQESAAEVRQEAEGEHMLNVFWDDLAVMVAEHDLGKEFIGVTPDRKQIAFWFGGTYSKWSEHYRKRTGQQPFDRNSIGRYIRDEDYFVEYKPYRISGTTRQCYFIDIDKATDSVREIAEQIQTREEQAMQPPHTRAG